MRALSLLLVASLAGAGELSTGATHEITLLPSSPYPIRGPRYAPVTLDLYFHFYHAPSLTGAELVRRAVDEAARGDVRAVLHLAPAAPSSASAAAELAAEALVEATVEDRAWPLVDRLLAQDAPLDAEGLGRLGRDAGLDGERLDAALAAHTHRDAVAQLLLEAQRSSRAAGELYVNGRRSSVYAADQLQAALDEARRRAQALVESGVPPSHLYEQLLTPHGEVERLPPPPRPRRRASLDLSTAPSRGPSLAQVTLVVYGNLALSSSSDVAEAVRRVREAHPGLVREVWRSFVPGYASSGSLEEAAAELAAGAAAQGRFWALHDACAQHRTAGVRRPYLELATLARAAGVDLDRLGRDAKAGLLRAVVARERAEAQKVGVPMAPSVLVNGILQPGVVSFGRLEPLVRAELERGLLERLQ